MRLRLPRRRRRAEAVAAAAAGAQGAGVALYGNGPPETSLPTSSAPGGSAAALNGTVGSLDLARMSELGILDAWLVVTAPDGATTRTFAVSLELAAYDELGRPLYHE